MTKHYYKQYLTGFTYYKMSNLDSRIGNPDQVFFLFLPPFLISLSFRPLACLFFLFFLSYPDQLLTQDIDKFATCLADLYSNISKPMLDITIYANKLAQNIGGLEGTGNHH